MGFFLGVDDRTALSGESERTRGSIDLRKGFVETAGLYPPQPVLEKKEWSAIRDYFIENAPAEAIPQETKTPSVGDAAGFVPLSTKYGPPYAITSLVHIDERSRSVLLFDARLGRLTVLDQELEVLESHLSPGVTLVEAKAFLDDRLHLLSIGDLFAAEIGAKYGEVQLAKTDNGKLSGLEVLLEGLHRPSDMLLADFDGDGFEEVVVSNFGEYTGNLALYPGKRGGGFASEAVVLNSQPGAVKSEAFDFDGDGRLDILVVQGHARENVSLYLNRGGLEFEQRVLLEKHPGFGYVDIELGDFNGDGKMDFLAVNGDNADSDPFNTLKRDHGIRIYLGDGSGNFEESYFYPMYGAFGAAVEDFDGDGDLDIAAIAYHSDFRAERPENFIYLEQSEEGGFRSRRLEAADKGRWLTINSGDLDGDGDAEIILGAAYLPVGIPPEQMDAYAELSRRGPAILVLDNQW
ncbi:FG-GAP repeat domain-containing protein [Pelagicoccus mobilis]|uniref:VCBS repeat-containing protein n=1 Tax=Pelagicoccus mobilis TaxID=415221 RepID=A0A934RVU3_9BACT|nr:VCBS repeat-containing protein [Pelagicoccus mobilis]MBK1875352.1 VCBS repeat-containing protein [Pelagicoccus mobilis]